MPSYQDFKSSPNHLYNTMKDVLQPKLQMMAMQQMQQQVPNMQGGNPLGAQKNNG
jgi:hypothetical protein